MEQYTPAFPIEVVCSPKVIPCFLAFGFHEVERHDSGGAVRLHKPDGCEGDLDRIVALAQAGVTLLADVERISLSSTATCLPPRQAIWSSLTRH